MLHPLYSVTKEGEYKEHLSISNPVTIKCMPPRINYLKIAESLILVAISLRFKLCYTFMSIEQCKKCICINSATMKYVSWTIFTLKP